MRKLTSIKRNTHPTRKRSVKPVRKYTGRKMK